MPRLRPFPLHGSTSTVRPSTRMTQLWQENWNVIFVRSRKPAGSGATRQAMKSSSAVSKVNGTGRYISSTRSTLASPIRGVMIVLSVGAGERGQANAAGGMAVWKDPSKIESTVLAMWPSRSRQPWPGGWWAYLFRGTWRAEVWPGGRYPSWRARLSVDHARDVRELTKR